MRQTSQVSATIPADLKIRIQEYAEKNRRTFSESVAILLEVGIKEKIRPRKATANA